MSASVNPSRWSKYLLAETHGLSISLQYVPTLNGGNSTPSSIKSEPT